MGQFYPTASTVAAFINGAHVDQAYSFSYQESVPKVPIYGYNDYEFSRVIRGRQMIQGMLVINFTHPSYMSDVLSSRQPAYVPTLYNYKIGEAAYSSNKNFEIDLKNNLRNELPPNTDLASKKARAEYIASIIAPSTGPTADPRMITQVKQALYSHFGANSELDEAQSFNTSQSALLSQTTAMLGNQLDIYYQDPTYINWFVRFSDVHFSEESQQISQAGAEGSSEPLYLIYQFIAKNKEIKRFN